MADPYREADRLQAIEARLRESTEQSAKLEKATAALVKTVDNKLDYSAHRVEIIFLRWVGTLLLVALLIFGGDCATSDLRASYACVEACGARGVAKVRPNTNTSTYECLCAGDADKTLERAP